MATAESVKGKLEGLIAKANGVTGKADSTLTQAVNALIAGFGQEGGGTVQTGSVTPAENLREVNLTVNGTCSNLVLYRVSDELIPDQRTLRLLVAIDLKTVGGNSWYYSERSSNYGDGWGYGGGSYGDSGVTFSEGGINIYIYPESGTFGWISAGDEYRWMAW